VKEGYWACPLDESSIPLTAFQSECGAWVWKCLPQGLSADLLQKLQFILFPAVGA
jgi:hypothetical protein